MGLVFLAEDPRLKRPVALKIMRPELAESGVARERFLREARVNANIRSDHIVAIHEVGQANDFPYIATELLSGKPLDVWLMEHARPTAAQVVDLGLQIARGLDACHRAGVIHRDIKPANIWVEEPTNRIKLLDFGLARFGGADANLTQAGGVLGTPGYMAPEQAEGRLVDERCDLYSLGCVLYETASSVKPLKSSIPAAIVKTIALNNPNLLQEFDATLPAEICGLVMRLLSKDPESRPASAAAVIEQLEKIADSLSTQPSKQSSISALQSPAATNQRTGRGLLIAMVAVLAGLLLLVSYFVLGKLPFLERGGAAAPGNLREAATEPSGQRQSSYAQGVSKDEILLGMSAPFSGPARELGRAMEVGIRTCFQQINHEGGIAGRKLQLVVLDDGYEPERALANMKELYEQRQVFAVIGNVGTPTAERTMPYALAKQIIFFGAFTGAPLLRSVPPDRYVFNYRASYPEETAALVKYLVEIKAIRPDQIAVFAQEDGYGDSGFNGVAKMLRKYGRRPEEILRVGHARNTVEVGDAVREILRHKEIRALVMVSTYRPAARLIRQLKDSRADLLFANVSFVGSDALAEELRQLGAEYANGVVVSQVVPLPSSQSSVVLKYRQLLRRYYPNEQPTSGSLEGYINAAILAEGLRRAGDQLTTETLVGSLEMLNSLDLGLGTPLHYSPSEHQASHKVWGTTLDRSGNYRSLELE